MNEVGRDKGAYAKNGYGNHAQPVTSSQLPNLINLSEKLLPIGRPVVHHAERAFARVQLKI
jgi:hypothetical protein